MAKKSAIQRRIEEFETAWLNLLPQERERFRQFIRLGNVGFVTDNDSASVELDCTMLMRKLPHGDAKCNDPACGCQERK